MGARDPIVPWKETSCFTPTKLRSRHESKMLVSVANHMAPADVNISHRAHCYLPIPLRRYQAELFHPAPDGSVEGPLVFPLAEESVRSSAHYIDWLLWY